MSSSSLSLITEKIIDFIGNFVLYNVLSPFTKTYNLPLTLCLILFTALLLGITLHFIGVTQFFNSIRLILGKGTSKSKGTSSSTSSMRSLFAIIAGSTGLGGIVGVSAVIVLSGPSVVFWILFVPFLITPLRFAEVFLSHKFRIKKEDGSFVGGPSIFLRTALTKYPRFGIFLSNLYGFTLLISSLGGASSYQSNQIVHSIILQFPSLQNKELLIVSTIVLIVGLIVFRNLKSIVKVLSDLAPITIIGYFASLLAVIFVNRSNIPDTLRLIITSAFDFQNHSKEIVLGILLGTSRTLLATEVGLGTASVMHSNSTNKDSVKEGIISMASPFISNFFVGFATLFTIALTGVYTDGVSGVGLISKAFSTVSPKLNIVLVSMIPLMGLSVMIAWSAYGVTSANAMFKSKIAGKIFLVLYMSAILLGGVISDFNIVSKLADVINITIAIPNVIGILLCLNMIRREYFMYLKNK